jgi:hypothetical protein
MKISVRILVSAALFVLVSGPAPSALAQSTNDCVTPPSGLVGWWKGDGTALDWAYGNEGVAVNVDYTNGIVGEAFSFNPGNYPSGTYTGVQIADQPQYVLTNALTIEGWIRPRDFGYIIFWRGDARPGLDPYVLSMQGNSMVFSICDENGNSDTASVTLTYGDWVYVAATFDSTAGMMDVYTNGVLAAEESTTVVPMGALDASASPGVGIGNLNDGVNNFPFTGDIDEISLYNRALSAAEIQSIYNAGSAGKCAQPLPPIIVTQPAPQTAVEGGAATFSVAAAGTGPFNYQWTFNGARIAGATNAVLSLTNLHPMQAGNYAAKVSSSYGATNSESALLTVTAQTVLVYKYTGTETLVSTGQDLTFSYSGVMFFVPDNTNGTYVGWATIKGQKTYWVNSVSQSLLITIPSVRGQSYTLLGDARSGYDDNGFAHFRCNFIKGWNTSLQVGKGKTFVFPNAFAGENIHAYPDSQTGLMKLDDSTSSFTFAASNTQTANNNGQTLLDLINNQVKILKLDGYQAQ